MRARSLVMLLAIVAVSMPAQSRLAGQSAASPAHLEDPFAPGWMIFDSNGDGVADALRGLVVVPDAPTATDNAAAANVAARLAFGSTGLTLPIVMRAADAARALEGPRIFVGLAAAPAAIRSQIDPLVASLAANEGGVFAAGSDLVLAGKDDAGLRAAAEAYTARAPFQWALNGDALGGIAIGVNKALDSGGAHTMTALIGVTYVKGAAGIRRALLRPTGGAAPRALNAALKSVRFSSVHDLVLVGGGASLTIPNPAAITSEPAASSRTLEPRPLDLVDLYTIKGLLGGAERMPVPASIDARLYVPGGEAGVAIANLAARLALESTVVPLPMAFPADGVTAEGVTSQAVVAGESAVASAVEKRLRDEDTSHSQAKPLAAGEGELRVVDEALAKHDALLLRGDDQGIAAAAALAAAHFPNLWDYGKQHLSLGEIRTDLHRFFSQRSSAGQATAALYHLDRWMKEIAATGGAVGGVEAELYVDLADPGLTRFVQQTVERGLHVSGATVRTGSLHAGTQCCDHGVSLGYQSPKYFHQTTPTFTDDIAVPWEGTRLLETVRKSLRRIRRGDAVALEARVSEGPEQRRKLSAQMADLLAAAGADRERLSIHVLSAYKQGYSWLMDDVAPALEGKHAARLRIEFAPNIDAERMSAISSRVRWEQELYPVDEMLATALNIPLDAITIEEMSAPATQASTTAAEAVSGPGDGPMPASAAALPAPAGASPTYRVHAIDAGGREVLTRDFAVTVHEREYNDTFPRYDRVAVETGWVRLQSGAKTLLDERIETDTEVFWEHYQSQTLPRIFKYLMAQAEGRPKQEYQPLFDTLLIDTHMSEPDYNLGLDKERISSLEMAMQEDLFYSTGNFFDMLGNLETGKPFTYPGRIITVVHPSEDGHDGRVRVEFYAKPAANPLVRLRWTDAKGAAHERVRDLPAMAGPMLPRLMAARVKSGQPGVESLMWRLPADYLRDESDEWRQVAEREQVEHQVVSVESAQGQIRWIERLHAAGVYPDALAYPNLAAMGVEFELPKALNAPTDKAPDRVLAEWSVPPPATKRPQIADYASSGQASDPIVQWDHPIAPRENQEILARLSKFPEVNAYWMGRSYLGQNIWAADVMLPTPSTIRSWAKETTLKAAIIYSGRQHADEVSSTSHIDKLGEQLVSDPETKAMLKQVNVVLHPITNPDGALLSYLLYQITPDNLLHTGYHGSLVEDVASAQWDKDTVYPESQTRRQLWEAWLPDAFLNPHGYPSHEWVQPFSGYTGWVVSRMGAYSGRSWWLPRGWFTSLTYLRDHRYPYSKDFAFAIRDRIADAMNKLPDLMALEGRMNARYQRFGQRWDPDYMLQPIVGGVRIYVALKGTEPSPTATSFMGRFPAVTYDDSYTEAPDETAYGPYLSLVASAGLAFDKVHLKYLAQGELRIKRSEKAYADGVDWKVERERPILPSSVPPVAPPADGK